ncbi:hypothetical protein SSX86_031509 [Deinandra increscens subsp. villosa]|uniref:Integrase catalytic domain-containing protein n=1 Tax=Deinandra increscens subsp. villosa TaxID=3103831 RepID=A0AAP0C9R8_9ASTR
MENKIHPAAAVTNIKSLVPITLDLGTHEYGTWSQLFKIACRANLVADHLLPRVVTPAPTEAVAKAAYDKAAEDWDRLDAIVLTWIYGTISRRLLTNVLKTDVTAYGAWTILAKMFQDNKTSRVLQLTQKLCNTRLDQFSDVSAYCQELKDLSDQLSNLDSPVSNQRLVLQLVSGLTEQYEGIAMLLQQSDPLPDFHEARSKLLLEETRKKTQALNTAQAAGAALHVAASPSSAPPSSAHQKPPNGDRNYRPRNRQQGRNNRKGQPAQYRAPFGVFNGGPQQPPWSPNYHWAGPLQQQWQPRPPVPYPTAGPSSAPGILGPRPAASYFAGYGSVAPNFPTYQTPIPTSLDPALQSVTLNPPDNYWYLDTGATNHMTNDPGNLTSILKTGILRNIIVGNGMTIPVTGQGHHTLPPPYPPLHLTNDLKTKVPILRCNSSGDLYPLHPRLLNNLKSPSTFIASSHHLWHQRLGHPGPDTLHRLKKLNSINVGKINKDTCQACVFGKSVRLPFVTSNSVVCNPFDIIHSDLWTSPILSSLGHRYYVLFIDENTNFLWTYPIAKKSDVFNVFSTFSKLIHTQFGAKIKQFQCDNGKEYANANFENFCRQNGMIFRFSCPYTSSQNGKAERTIRSINNIIRTLLAQSSLPPSFWHHALDMATYILNILPSKTLNYNTPTFLLYRRHPSYTHLRVFGCLCYPLLPPTSIHKLDPRSRPCIFLGYPAHHRGYKCLDLSNNHIILSRHVVFDESTFPYKSRPSAPSTETYQFLTDPISPLLWPFISSPTRSPPAQTTQAQPSVPLTQQQSPGSPPPPVSHGTNPSSPPSQTTSQPTTSPSTNTTVPPTPTPPPTRTMHTRSMSGIYKPKHPLNLNVSSIVPIPKNPKTALSIPEWHHAMTDEFNALVKNKTWELVPRRDDMNIIRSIWLASTAGKLSVR